VSLLALSVVKGDLLNLITHLLVVLGLLLLSTAVLFGFFLHDANFALETIQLVIGLDLFSDHVTAHAVDHVLVGAL
jgi:hypothetical protein